MSDRYNFLIPTPFLVAAVVLSLAVPAYADLLKDQTLVNNGDTRTYDLYIPSNIDGHRPLVLLLHGHFGDADAMTGVNRKKSPYKVWLTIAEREGWYLIIPDGSIGPDGYRGWNDCRQNAKTNPDTDDVAFLNRLIDAVAHKYSINTNRVYVHGTSNGGNMAYRLAQEAGNKYRAIAAVVAAMPEKNKCRHSNQPISVLIMNGTEDPILPFNGGRVGRKKSHHEARGSVLSTADTLAYWLNNNGIDSKPIVMDYPDVIRKDKSTIHVKRYSNSNNKTEVTLFEVRGGGHTEPSLTEHYRALYTFIVGRQNQDIEMAEEVWKFFVRNQ
ncbi:MAG: prolyl oligopeptidase family serine peptidase [Pseudomonadales bacterium]|nr:prolyl oligopeptidase family serine peptidase [Pseudomonadales bacterium]